MHMEKEEQEQKEQEAPEAPQESDTSTGMPEQDAVVKPEEKTDSEQEPLNKEEEKESNGQE